MKQWIVDTLIAVVILPGAWFVLPSLFSKWKEPVNEAIKNILRKTKSLWKGHKKDLENVVEKTEQNIISDIEDVDSEDKP